MADVADLVQMQAFAREEAYIERRSADEYRLQGCGCRRIRRCQEQILVTQLTQREAGS